jgi:hypothetical protein
MRKQLDMAAVAIIVDLFRRRRIYDALGAIRCIIAPVSVKLATGIDTSEYAKL